MNISDETGGLLAFSYNIVQFMRRVFISRVEQGLIMSVCVGGTIHCHFRRLGVQAAVSKANYNDMPPWWKCDALH